MNSVSKVYLIFTEKW